MPDRDYYLRSDEKVCRDSQGLRRLHDEALHARACYPCVRSCGIEGLTDRSRRPLALVPQVRADVFVGGLSVRPAVALRWNF